MSSGSEVLEFLIQILRSRVDLHNSHIGAFVRSGSEVQGQVFLFHHVVKVLEFSGFSSIPSQGMELSEGYIGASA